MANVERLHHFIEFSTMTLSDEHLKLHLNGLVPVVVESLGEWNQPIKDIVGQLLVALMEVLSITLDGWSDDEIDSMMEVGGNSYANSIYEAFLPIGTLKAKADSSNEDRTKFIRSKYELQEFLKPSLRMVSSKSSFRYDYGKVLDKNYGLVRSRKQESLGEFIGMLKVKVIRGSNLAIRDIRTSDPYVILTLGQQAYFPAISQPEGLPLRVQDAGGKEWVFSFVFGQIIITGCMFWRGLPLAFSQCNYKQVTQGYH